MFFQVALRNLNMVFELFLVFSARMEVNNVLDWIMISFPVSGEIFLQKVDRLWIQSRSPYINNELSFEGPPYSHLREKLSFHATQAR